MAAPAVQTIQLRHPIVTVFRGPDGEREETLTTLQLRTAIKARDLRVTDGVTGEISKTLALIAQLAGISVREADELSIEDIAVIGEILGNLLPAGLLTGPTA